MTEYLVKIIHFFNRKWVKWPVLTMLAIVLTAVHIVMHRKYAGTPEAPTWQFTLLVHGSMALAFAVAVIFYNKQIKHKLTDK